MDAVELSERDMAQMLGQAMDMHAMSWLMAVIRMEQERCAETVQLLYQLGVRRQESSRDSTWTRSGRKFTAAVFLIAWAWTMQSLGLLLGVALYAKIAEHVARRSEAADARARAARAQVLLPSVKGMGSSGRGSGKAMGASSVGSGGGVEEPVWANQRYRPGTADEMCRPVPSKMDSSLSWKCGKQLSARQAEQLVSMAESFGEELWVSSAKNLRPVKGWEFCLPTTNDVPIRRKPYRLSKYEWEYVGQWSEELIEAGAVEESQSPYALPVVTPPKKDDDGNWTGIRVCVDARPLNEVTPTYAYLNPTVDELLRKVSGARMYSQADAKSAFTQWMVGAEFRPKLSFLGSGCQWQGPLAAVPTYGYGPQESRMPVLHGSRCWMRLWEICLLLQYMQMTSVFSVESRG